MLHFLLQLIDCRYHHCFGMQEFLKRKLSPFLDSNGSVVFPPLPYMSARPLISGRVMVRPRFPGEPPLLSLTLSLSADNVTVQLLNLAEGQPKQEGIVVFGGLEGTMYVPSLGRQFTVYGGLRAQLLLDSSGAEAALVGQATLLSKFSQKAYGLPPPQEDGSFSASVKVANSTCPVMGVLHLPGIQPGTAGSLYGYHSASLNCSNTTVAAIYDTFSQLNMTKGPELRG